MQIAYLLYTYPALSQAFILREVQELRRLGFEVHPYSLRAPEATDLLAEADRQEAARTVSLLPADLPRLALAHLLALAGHPVAYLRTLLSAVREVGLNPKAIARELANFAFAVLIWTRLRRAGVRHVHTHFAGTPSHIASLVVRFGNAVEGDLASSEPRWTWSATIHGPVEFFDVSSWRLRQRARDAKFIAYVSTFARDQLLMATDAADWGKLHLVRCGLDAERFEAPARNRGPDDRVELLTVGRHVEVKSPHVLIRAIGELVRRGRDVRLTMIGHGPLTPSLQRLAHAVGAAEQIEFAGARGQDEVPGFYARADIFCLSSVAESLPVVLMEAMASRLPVVSTRVGGIADLVEDGVNGLLVRPGDPIALADALEDLGADPERRREMGERGRQRVESEFQISRWAGELAELLRSG